MSLLQVRIAAVHAVATRSLMFAHKYKIQVVLSRTGQGEQPLSKINPYKQDMCPSYSIQYYATKNLKKSVKKHKRK